MSQALILSDPVPTVSLHDGRPATTSLEVAKFFGKRHDHVMRGIKDIIDNCAESLSAPNFGAANSPKSFSAHNFVGASYLDEQAKNRPMYIIYRDGFMLLVMGYTGKKALAIKLAYIEAFNAMEEELARKNRPACQRAAAHAGNPCRPSPALFPDRASMNGLSSNLLTRLNGPMLRCRTSKSVSYQRRTG